ncbi:MAG: type II toxin-antitoxin system HicB family antitoxin [Armatimonadetes bacterium]|nr:type II toxin-antitoxin system HicB family antitoxin [Armatimonadota bacterium]
MTYLVVTEHGDSSWGAHVPDLPGCVAVGDTEEEVLSLIGEAIDAHLELLGQSGEPIPQPRTYPHVVEVAG